MSLSIFGADEEIYLSQKETSSLACSRSGSSLAEAFPFAGSTLSTTENTRKFTEIKLQCPYLPTILQNILCLILQIFLYLKGLECYTTSDWVNRMVQPIRSCVTFQLANLGRKRRRMLMRMVGEYGALKSGFKSISNET